MRTFVAVVQREILQRKQILMAAAVLAFVPILAPYLPNVAASDRHEVTTVLGVIALGAYGIATAFTLGASMIGRDLSEKRLGFYFSRPISASALFWGKFFGSALIVMGAVALILLPLLIFKSELREDLDGPLPGLVLIFTFGGPICLLVANVLGSMVRSRSKIAFLDVVAATLTGLSIYSLLPGVFASGAENAAIAMAIVFAVALVAALAAASIAHLAHGRTDPKRGHAALSLTLWSVVGAALVVMFGYTLWFFASDPGDVVQVGHAYALPSGSRVVVAGPVRGRLGFWEDFVVDPSTDQAVRLAGRANFPRAFSRDGGTVAWVQPTSFKTANGELLTLDLEHRDQRPRPTAIFASLFDNLVLSPSGERAAILAGETLTVYELDSGQALFSARIPSVKNQRSRMMFVTGDLVRVVVYAMNRSDSAAPLSLFDVDVPGRRLVQKALAPMGWKTVFVSASPAGDGLLLRGGGEDHPLAVIDLGSGKRLDLPGSPGARGLPALLSNGRVAIPRVNDGAVSLELRTREGALERIIPLGPGGRLGIGWEVAAGKLMVTVHVSTEGGASPDGWTALLVDLEKGEVAAREGGLRTPDFVLRRWVENDLLDGPVVGSPGAMTFLDAKGSVVRWNPLTGERKVVFKAR